MKRRYIVNITYMATDQVEVEVEEDGPEDTQTNVKRLAKEKANELHPCNWWVDMTTIHRVEDC